jgi:hypothetical protein
MILLLHGESQSASKKEFVICLFVLYLYLYSVVSLLLANVFTPSELIADTKS